MKPHLSSSLRAWLSASAIACCSFAAAGTATIGTNTYEYTAIQVWTGTATTTPANATWLGGSESTTDAAGRIKVTDASTLNNVGTLIVADGTANISGTDSEVKGAQLYVTTYGASETVNVTNALLVGPVSYHEGGDANAWGGAALRLDSSGGSANKRVVLSGQVTLAGDAVFFINQAFNYIDGAIAGDGQKLTLNKGGTLNLSGGAQLGELELLSTAVKLNATNSSGGAASSLAYTIGTKSGAGTMTVASGVTLNLGTQTAGTLNALEGSTVRYSGETFAGTLSGATTFIKEGNSALSTGSAFTAKNIRVEGGSLNLNGATLVIGGEVTLAGGSVGHLALNAGTTLKQDGSNMLSDLTLNGGTVSFEGLDNTGYSLTGNLALGSTVTTIDLTGSTNFGIDSVLFSGVSFTDGFTWNETEWARYFVFNGTDENWRVAYDETNSSLIIAASLAADLTWNNDAGSNVWNTTDTNWSGASGSAAFQTGDAVTFSGATGTVTVDGAGVLASKITVANSSDMTWSGGAVTGPAFITEGSHLTLNNTLSGLATLSGGSTLTIGAGGTLAGNVFASEASTLAVNSGTFTGTVNLTGGSILSISGTGVFGGALIFGDTTSKLVLKKSGPFSASSTISGSGIIEIDWGTTSSNTSGKIANFTGALQITSGRYAAGSTLLNAASISVTEGGQFYIEGGTWTQTFNLAGSGWSSSSDTAKNGSLRLDNGTISGAVNLTEDTSITVWSGRTGTISSALNGAGKTLTKIGAGTLVLSSSDSAIGHLIINAGTVKLSKADSDYASIGKVTINSGGTLNVGVEYGIDLSCSDITIAGGGRLNLDNSTLYGSHVGTNGGTITIDATADSHAIISGSRGGTNTVLSSVTGKGTLELQRATSDSTNPMVFSKTISDGTDGQLAILQTSGNYSLNAKNSSYSGGTIISGGTMTAGADGALGTGDVEVREGGTLKTDNVTLNNTVRSMHSVTEGTATTWQTVATITAKAGSAGVHYSKVQHTGTGISSTDTSTKASVSHANIAVEGTYSLNNVLLVDSLVTIQSAGSLSLTNVALGQNSAVVKTDSGTAAMSGSSNSVTVGLSEYTRVSGSLTYTPAESSEALTFIGVTNTQLNGVSMTDASLLTIDVTNDLLCSFELRNGQYLAVTFEGLTGTLTAGNFALDSHLTAGFEGAGILGVETAQTGGTTVYIGFAPQQMPEPAASALGLLGVAGLLLRRRRKS